MKTDMTDIEAPSELGQAINHTFALFRVNFHNQYYKAYSDKKLLRPVKRIWLEGLKNFSADTVVAAAEKIILEQEFLPTLKKMRQRCLELQHGTPSSHAAYVEACCAPSPKAAVRWSHPVVYAAGRCAGWFFLANTEERFAYPVFRKCYEEAIEGLQAGKAFEVPALPSSAAKESTEPPLPRAEVAKRLASLRERLRVAQSK
ncbi:MAG: hypothetical protein GDA55_01410 [Cellvibrionales bacterium]|nr:hypothetical protein [Cellvibrionales bacterium]